MSAAERVAIVTGGSRGIGRAIALELARRGTVVALTYRSRSVEAEDAVKAIEAAGGRAAAFACEASDFAAVERVLAEATERFGRLDILVNNAGIVQDQLILRMKPEEFDSVIAANLRGTWNFCRLAARGLVRARWGRIINLSSVVAAMGNAGQSNYAASKGGIEALTRSLARELASRNITVNAVAPGFIETEMTQGIPEAARERLLGEIPLGRMGTVEEVAHAVGFLASEEAAYITGQVIHVNGGLH